MSGSVGEFQRCLKWVLVIEGGYIDDPDDPGGATNQGVTQRVYDDYRRSMGNKPQPVRLMANHERDAIYRIRYWALIKADSLPPGVSLVVFDGAVHSGVSQSVKWLQRAVGVPADGVIGPQTLTAVRAFDNPGVLIERICGQRLMFLQALKTWKKYRNGWTKRVANVRTTAQQWALAMAAPEVAAIAGAEKKALLADAKAPPPKAPGDIAAGGGTMSAIITQATDQLTPLTSIPFVAHAVTALTVAGVVVAIGGIGYRAWANRRANQLADALGVVAHA
jgi:lysozyme family protein